MRRFSILACVLASAPLVACSQGKFEPRPVGLAPVTTPEEALARARRNFALNNVALALEDFRKAARANPEDIRALNGIAACYDRMGRFDLSRIYYEKALALAPENPGTQHNYRLSLNLQGMDDERVTFAAPKQPQPDTTGAEPVRDIAQATGNEVITLDLDTTIAASPKLKVSAGPRLERISLREVALVFAEPETLTTPRAPRPKAASRTSRPRVADVIPARLVRQTAQSSEWAFDEPPAKPAPAAAKSAPPRPARLQVLNAVGRRGLAARYRNYLKSRGWTDIGIADAARRQDRSIILHGDGQARLAARSLAAGLPFRARVVTAKPTRPTITLVLGTDSLRFDTQRLKNPAPRS